MTVRVIPRLDIKGPNVVKGVHLEGLRVVGRPEAYAATYYAHGADELLYMDVVASLYGRNNILDVVRRTAREVFIPITVGGGIRTLEDIRDVLRAGADKVAINTAAVANPRFIRDAATRFGSSTIVVSIEAIFQASRGYEVFTESGREATGLDAVVWAVQAVEHGAGEVMITSVDREGTGKGFDLELTRQIADVVSVPVIAGGGAGRADDVVAVFRDGRADAASVASILHYDLAAHIADTGDFVEEGNTEFFRHLRVPAQVHPTSLPELKRHLADHGVKCRPVGEVASGD